jgi:hypothetical protein
MESFDFYSLFWSFGSKCLTFNHTHPIEWKEREFEHGSTIGNSTANLEGIGK